MQSRGRLSGAEDWGECRVEECLDWLLPLGGSVESVSVVDRSREFASWPVLVVVVETCLTAGVCAGNGRVNKNGLGSAIRSIRVARSMVEVLGVAMAYVWCKGYATHKIHTRAPLSLRHLVMSCCDIFHSRASSCPPFPPLALFRFSLPRAAGKRGADAPLFCPVHHCCRRCAQRCWLLLLAANAVLVGLFVVVCSVVSCSGPWLGLFVC